MSPKIVLYIQENEDTKDLTNAFKSWALSRGLKYSIELPTALDVPAGLNGASQNTNSSQETWFSGQSFKQIEEKFSMSSHNKKQQILSMEEVEAHTIRGAIEAYEGNLSQVARKLKISRATLYRKIKQYSIIPNEWISGFKKAA